MISERIASGAFGNIVAQICAAENSAIRACGSVSSRGSAGMGLIRSYACTPLKSGFLVLNSDKSENGRSGFRGERIFVRESRKGVRHDA